MLYLNASSTMLLLTVRIVYVLERRNTMTMIDAVLMNGAQYLCSLGLLAMAWARLQREK